MALKPYSIQLDEEQYEHLRGEAFQSNTSISSRVRNLLNKAWGEDEGSAKTQKRRYPVVDTATDKKDNPTIDISNIGADFGYGKDKSVSNEINKDDVTTPVTTTHKDLPPDLKRFHEDVSDDLAQDARETDRCQAPNTNCKNEGYLYQVTFMTDEGEKKKQVFLCDAHLKKTRDSGMEVAEV